MTALTPEFHSIAKIYNRKIFPVQSTFTRFVKQFVGKQEQVVYKQKNYTEGQNKDETGV